MLSIIYIPSDTKAVGSKVWTTTTDFDSGNKSDPGPNWFANDALDQPMYTQITQPQAIYSPSFQRTYVAYFAAKNGSIHVTYYDHITNLWRTSPKWLDSVGSSDGHKNPAIYVMTSGRIVVACCAHDSTIKIYRTTTTTGNIDSWVLISNITGVKTYPGFIEYPTGTIWIFYRTTSIAASGDLGYRKSTNEAISWSSEVPFIDEGGDTLYWGKWDIEGTKLYIPWVKLNFTGRGTRQDVFVCYMELTTGEGFSLSGTNLGTTINPTEANSSCRVIKQLGPRNNNHPALDVLDSKIYLLYLEGTNASSAWYVNYTSWNGIVWSSPIKIADIGASSSYADLLVSSSTNAEALITTTGFTYACSGDCEFTGDLERWTWNGISWTQAEILLTEEKAGNPINHPYYVWNAYENGQIKIKAVFDEFTDLLLPQPNPGQGRFGQQKVYAWGSNGFVGRSGNDGTTGTETYTDNNQISNGTFQLANGRHDTFIKPDPDADNWKFHFIQSDDGITDCVKSISSGVMKFNWTGDGDTGRKGCWAAGTFALVGNFDWRIKFSVPDQAGVNGHRIILYLMDLPGTGMFTFSPNSNGGTIEFFPNFFGDRIIKTFRNTGGSVVQIGTDTIPGNIAFLRITRTAITTWTTYYSIDGSSWTQDETFTGTANSIFAQFGTFVSGMTSGTLQVNFDDFSVLTGTLDDEGYHSQGKWDSPVTIYTGEVAKSIVVGYSGASATRYIDQIAIVNSQGTILKADETNRISDTSANFTFTDDDLILLFNEDWSIRISLIGNGTGSIVINDVTVYTVRSLLTNAISDWPWIAGFIAVVTLGFMGSWWIRGRRKG